MYFDEAYVIRNSTVIRRFRVRIPGGFLSPVNPSTRWPNGKAPDYGAPFCLSSSFSHPEKYLSEKLVTVNILKFIIFWIDTNGKKNNNRCDLQVLCSTKQQRQQTTKQRRPTANRTPLPLFSTYWPVLFAQYFYFYFPSCITNAVDKTAD